MVNCSSSGSRSPSRRSHKYMIRRRGPPSQTWRTFLRNHAEAIAAIDLCVVPTLTFECLFAFLVLGHGRRQLLWFAVTRVASENSIHLTRSRRRTTLAHVIANSVRAESEVSQ